MTIFFIKKLSKDLRGIVKRHIFASLLIAMSNALTIGNNKNIGNFLINKEIPSVFNMLNKKY